MNTLLKNYYKKQTRERWQKVGLLLLVGLSIGLYIQLNFWLNEWLMVRDLLLFNI